MRWSVTRPAGSYRCGCGRCGRRCPAGCGAWTLPPAGVLPLRRRGCAEHRQFLGFVFMLRTLVLALHHDAGGQVGNADSRVGGVNVLTACPEERKVSMRRSAGLMSGISASGSSGITATVQAEVWIRPCDSVAGTRCTRWPPDSNFSRP